MSDYEKLKQNFDCLEGEYNKLLSIQRKQKAKIDQYQQILNLLPEYIFGIDENGKYLWANKKMADEFNVPLSEVEGKMDYEIITNAEELESHRKMRKKVLETNQPLLIPEFIGTNAAGKKIPVEIRRIPYIDNFSGLKAVLGTANDISERKRIEQELFEKKSLEKDIQIARSIQQGLLPEHEPVIKGFEIAGWNQPADDTGGDYYDWLELPDGELAFTIADASGHGVGPALMAAVCRAYIRASHAIGEELGAMMTNVNNLLADDLKNGRFITAVVSMLNPLTKTLDVYSAGHAPLFFYSAEKRSVELLDADDIPLGIQKKTKTVNPRIIKFSPGDIFVMVTDGFFGLGMPDENEDDVIERIKLNIATNHLLSPGEMISSLHNTLLSIADVTEQRDDLTAVILKCNI